MTLAKQTADRLRRTVSGPMWHGPALDELLAGVSAGDAAAHAVPGGHSIWELALHIASWAEIAAERLAGGSGDDPPPSRDWPPLPRDADAGAWAEAQSRLRAAHERLASAVEALDDEALARPVRGRRYDAITLLNGVVEHGTYHGGQIALLKRGLMRRA